MAQTVEIPTILTPIPAITKTVSNTTLFHLAAQFLGDATMWNFIVARNPGMLNADGFWEYDIAGTATIIMPPKGANVSNGGILNAFPVPAAEPVKDFNDDFAAYRFQ